MKQLILGAILSLSLWTAYAGCCEKIKQYNVCCGQMGGVSYCDSSQGRLICMNGYVSACYCSKRAAMDINLLEGCCLWRGGILDIVEGSVVVCRDGSISMQCTDLNSISSSVQGIYRTYDNDL